MISIVLRGGGRFSFLSGQGFTGGNDPESIHPELVSGSNEAEAAEIDKDRFRNEFGMTKTPRHPELVSGSFGFTLAEVLITLGIIGIVAALTLPSIIQKRYEKETVSRVKKAYTVLQQAFMMTVQENGTPDEWGATGMYESTSHIFLARKFIPYLKVTTDCTGMTTTKVAKYCTKKYADSASYASIKIADGTTVIFRIWNGKCNNRYGTPKPLQNVCGEILIDTNATAKPDIQGQDVFFFYLSKNGLYPIGTQFDKLSMKTHCTKTRVWGQIYSGYLNGGACTAWVLYNENMDYLHCELDWESGKKSCKK